MIDDEFSWNNFYFIFVKEFWYGKNIGGFLMNLFEYYFLNIAVNVHFFSDLNLNTTVSTTIQYCYK